MLMTFSNCFSASEGCPCWSGPTTNRKEVCDARGHTEAAWRYHGSTAVV
jgi:hypothetical protein